MCGLTVREAGQKPERSAHDRSRVVSEAVEAPGKNPCFVFCSFWITPAFLGSRRFPQRHSLDLGFGREISFFGIQTPWGSIEPPWVNQETSQDAQRNHRCPVPFTVSGGMVTGSREDVMATWRMITLPANLWSVCQAWMDLGAQAESAGSWPHLHLHVPLPFVFILFSVPFQLAFLL